MVKHLFLLSMGVSIVLMSMFIQMVEKTSKSKEKKSAFECGFDMMSYKKMTFSTNFMVMLMMFLIFDVEISILTPLVIMNKNTMKNMMNLFNIIIIILTGLMVKEWKQGSLEWNQ